MPELHNISEPLKLVGEGKYNLNAVKEIKVTDSYLGLDMKDKGCQNEEPQGECITKHFISTLLKDCGCLPLKLTGPQNVRTLRTSYFNWQITSQEPVCSHPQMKCIENIKFNSSICMKSCNGLMVTGYTKLFEIDENIHQENIQKTINAFRAYKKWFKFPHGIKGTVLNKIAAING